MKKYNTGIATAQCSFNGHKYVIQVVIEKDTAGKLYLFTLTVLDVETQIKYWDNINFDIEDIMDCNVIDFFIRCMLSEAEPLYMLIETSRNKYE